MKQSKFMAYDSFGPGGKAAVVSVALHALLILLLLFFSTPMMKDMIPSRVIFVTFPSLGESAIKNPPFVPASVIQSKPGRPLSPRLSSDMKIGKSEAKPPQAAVPKDAVPIGEDDPAAERLHPVTMEQTNTDTAGAGNVSESGASEAVSSNVGPAQGSPHAQVPEGRFGERGAPTFIHREIPVYPALARRLGKEGRVLLKLQIDAEGKLMAVEVIEAAGFGFTEASVEAVRKSTYSPGIRNGTRVAMRVLLPVSFRLQ